MFFLILENVKEEKKVIVGHLAITKVLCKVPHDDRIFSSSINGHVDEITPDLSWDY